MHVLDCDTLCCEGSLYIASALDRRARSRRVFTANLLPWSNVVERRFGRVVLGACPNWWTMKEIEE